MSGQPAIYIDACCFIDIIKFDVNATLEEGRAGEVWYLKKLLQAHRDKEITVHTSVLTVAEAVHAGASPVPVDVQKGLDAFLTSGQYVNLVQVTPFTCIDARNLRWIDQINLSGADSIHLASAIEMKCSEFHSLNGRFGRLQKFSDAIIAKGVTVVIPSKTKVLPGRYLQGDLLETDIIH